MIKNNSQIVLTIASKSSNAEEGLIEEDDFSEIVDKYKKLGKKVDETLGKIKRKKIAKK